jgi:hypothetical protein
MGACRPKPPHCLCFRPDVAPCNFGSSRIKRRRNLATSMNVQTVDRLAYTRRVFVTVCSTPVGRWLTRLHPFGASARHWNSTPSARIFVVPAGQQGLQGFESHTSPTARHQPSTSQNRPCRRRLAAAATRRRGRSAELSQGPSAPRRAPRWVPLQSLASWASRGRFGLLGDQLAKQS